MRRVSVINMQAIHGEGRARSYVAVCQSRGYTSTHMALGIALLFAMTLYPGQVQIL